MIKRTCKICKKIFYVSPSHLKIRPVRTCSRKCSGIYRSRTYKGRNNPLWKKRAIKKCPICGSIFLCKQVYKKIRKTCSRKCAKIYFSKNNSGENNWRWNGGRRKRGRYIAILKRNHPHSYSDGYLPEHRYIMEKHIGRYLKTNEYIHHKNFNPFDNRIKNLQILSPSEHTRFHRLHRKH